MDDYDPRRLQAFIDKKIKLSPEELKALASVDPNLSEEDLHKFAEAAPNADSSHGQRGKINSLKT